MRGGKRGLVETWVCGGGDGGCAVMRRAWSKLSSDAGKRTGARVRALRSPEMSSAVKMMSPVVFPASGNPLAHVPTTMHTPSGRLPQRACRTAGLALPCRNEGVAVMVSCGWGRGWVGGLVGCQGGRNGVPSHRARAFPLSPSPPPPQPRPLRLRSRSASPRPRRHPSEKRKRDKANARGVELSSSSRYDAPRSAAASGMGMKWRRRSGHGAAAAPLRAACCRARPRQPPRSGP